MKDGHFCRHACAAVEGLLVLAIAALLLVIFLTARRAEGQIPTDEYTVDYRIKSSQYHLTAPKGSTPAFVFKTYVGSTAWTGTGWTLVLKWSRSWDSEAMGCITGTVATGQVTFQASATSFTNVLTGGYSAILASTGTVNVTFGEGTFDVVKAPEIP